MDQPATSPSNAREPSPTTARFVANQATFDRAIRLHRQGSLAEADEIYQQILGAQPEHAGALHLSGLVCHQQGRHAEALTLIGRAITKDPRQSVYFNNYGAASLALSYYVEALACFHRGFRGFRGHRRFGDSGDGIPGTRIDIDILGNMAFHCFRYDCQPYVWHLLPKRR